MKFINKYTFLGLLLLVITNVTAQKKVKIDGVVAVVGEYVILDSDIDLEYIQLKAEGIDISEISRCELFGKKLEEKLYTHHAIQDSIIVTDAEVNAYMEEQLDAMIEQVGDMQKVLDYYRKSSEDEFRSYFFEVIKNNKLTDQMQKKIFDGVEITPEEVRNFYKEIPANEIPTFGAEVEVAQIVIEPKVTQEAKQDVIDKLKQIKKEVQEGASFFSKAVLFSEDEASSPNGGFYKMNRKTPFVKEFKDVAFSLSEGEISEPFETVFGYHIIYIEKIKGQDVDLRHILIAPKVANSAMEQAKIDINIIRDKILAKEITFQDAAKVSSDEKETKNNGGVLLNPRTLEPRFELSKMDPTLYARVSNLKEGEISYAFIDQDKNKKFYKIVSIIKRTDEHKADFANDYIKIKELALRDKKIRAVEKWTEEKIKQTYIKIDSEYQNCEFASNWLKK